MRILPPRHRHKPIYESNVGLLICVRYEHKHQLVRQTSNTLQPLQTTMALLVLLTRRDFGQPWPLQFSTETNTQTIPRYSTNLWRSGKRPCPRLSKATQTSLPTIRTPLPSSSSHSRTQRLEPRCHAIREAVNGLTYEDPHLIIYQVRLLLSLPAILCSSHFSI